MPSLSVVIVNWNSGEHLRRGVAALPAREDDLVLDVLVIDNASEDGSCERLVCAAPLRVLHNDVNEGFGRACNRGVRETDSDYVLFLNPDVVVRPGAIAEACRVARDEHVAFVGVRLEDEGGVVARTCARRPTPWLFWRTMLGLDALGVAGEELHLVSWDHRDRRDVDHVMGAFVVVRRERFVALGGFDERFFVFLEDLDLSLRARDAGWRVVFLGDVAVTHVGGATTRGRSGVRLSLAVESRVRFAFKHFSPWAAAAITVGSFVVEPPLRLARAIAGAGPDEPLGVVRGTIGALRRLART